MHDDDAAMARLVAREKRRQHLTAKRSRFVLDAAFFIGLVASWDQVIDLIRLWGEDAPWWRIVSALAWTAVVFAWTWAACYVRWTTR